MSVDVLPWNDLHSLFKSEAAKFFRIKSGMHVALLGTTRGGKTTLAIGSESNPGLLSHWENCLVLDTTGDPGPLKDYGKPLTKFGGIRGHQRLTVSDMTERSRERIHKAIGRAVRQGHTAIYADELRQLIDKKFFGLGPVFDHLWLFTAKRGISLVAGSQAPRWLSSAFYEQSKAHFIFGIRDRRAMKRLAEISGDVDTLELVIPTLNDYQFAYVGTNGAVSVSQFELKPRRKVARQPGLTVVRGL